MQPFDLEREPNDLSWEWLVDISSRLNLVIELIDAEARPLLPAGSSREARSFRRMIGAGDPEIRSAMADALRSKRRVPVALDGVEALCCGLEAGGLLLLARATSEAAAEECREDLDLIASWLIGAVTLSLTRPGAVNVEAYRLVSFRRILREATSRGVVREVIGAFVEALSVWDDVRVHCYIAGASNGFLHYASAFSALPSSFPDRIDESRVPRVRAIAPVSRADAAGMGLTPEPGDMVISRLAVGDIGWLLLFSGVIDDREQVRLRVYCDMLRESLTEAVSAATNHLVAQLARRDAPAGEPLEAAAHPALASLIDAVGGREGAMAVTHADGRPRLVIGDADLLASVDQARRGDLVVKSSAAGSTMTAVIAREQPPFNAFERDLVQAGAAVTHRAVLPGLQRSAHGERRRQSRPLDVVFDEIAGQSITHGRPASVIVFAIDDAPLRHGLLPAWVRCIRSQLRAGDFAGLLNEREIAVLLCGASADQAAAVSARLARKIESYDRSGAFVRAAIGMTTWMPHSPANGSIVAAARASAASSR